MDLHDENNVSLIVFTLPAPRDSQESHESLGWQSFHRPPIQDRHVDVCVVSQYGSETRGGARQESVSTSYHPHVTIEQGRLSQGNCLLETTPRERLTDSGVRLREGQVRKEERREESVHSLVVLPDF